MKLRVCLCALVAIVAAGAVWWLLKSGNLPDVPKATASERPGDGLGFSAAFESELKKVGPITPREFSRRYGGKTKHLTRLSWDPTTATFWDRFCLDPADPTHKVRLRGQEEKLAREYARGIGKPIPDDRPIWVSAQGGYDFRLDERELAKFRKNGFVVSERMGAASCTELYYRIYKRDLPVFISADSILHAWHRSYDALLEEVETETLIPALAEILEGMSAQVAEARRAYGKGLMAEAVADADYFLAVARSLLTGVPARTATSGDDSRVEETLRACRAQQLQEFPLFGLVRDVDFSQFKPRGHYEKSEALRRYFEAMMWCGRIDLRVAGDPTLANPRQLAGAVVLHDLLRRSGKFTRWEQFDRILCTFVGRAASMTFAQLGVVLEAAGVRSPADVATEEKLAALRDRITSGDFGEQQIRGDVFYTQHLPRSFTLLGQRFAVDSWATAKVVFNDIDWKDRKVMRRIPSSLDVAFAAFGNDHAVPALVRRMKDTGGRKFRDGLNYQHNLAAVREVIDHRPESMWSESIYTGWLASLRELSKPTAGANYPEAMRTEAWAMKSLNTQLASWTQLRHDTILYVKQSYTAGASCYYPAGYVEPVPHFWAQLEATVKRAATLIEQTPAGDRDAQQKQVQFLSNFAARVATLRQIAEKELAGKPLSAAETKFLEDVVEKDHARAGSGRPQLFTGWYPGLFYTGPKDSEKWDALVADVHTNPPCGVAGDPGCVLHQGVGGVDLLVIAVDSGKDRMAYAGPVLSHYEFEMPGVARLSDSEWKKRLKKGKAPARPEWTSSYLVPGENKARAGYDED